MKWPKPVSANPEKKQRLLADLLVKTKGSSTGETAGLAANKLTAPSAGRYRLIS